MSSRKERPLTYAEQLHADYLVLCDEAKSQGWPASFAEKLDQLEADYREELARSNKIDMRGFPFTPYKLQYVVEQIRKQPNYG